MEDRSMRPFDVKVGISFKVVKLLGSVLVAFLTCPIPTPAQNAGTFVPTGNMTTPRIVHTATLLPNGKVLIAGGSNAHPASAELYDPVTGMFAPTGNMTTGRSGHSAVLLPDGRVLISGGDIGSSLGTAEVYDPSNGTFTPTGNMVTPQASHTATLLDDGKVLISGGESVADYAAANPELYDPLTGTFSPAGEYAKTGPQNPYGSGEWGMIAPPTLLLPSHKVLIAGEPSTEVYDPVTGTFTLAGTMTTHPFGETPYYVEGRTGTLLMNGKVLLTGGENEDLGYFADAELYDPATGKFTAANNMTRPRADHTATQLRDETVLIAGTQLFPGADPSTELYDPATGRFIATANMIFPRFFHTATLLFDGRVLIAGGFTSYPASPNSNSAELYVPSVLIPAQVVARLGFDRTSVVAGTSYLVNVSGANIDAQTFFDVRFIAPGSKTSDVVLNWQRGVGDSHVVPAGTASGIWTINGVRPHQIETDHTGNFFPVLATIMVSP
jgi:hypothetical protein